MKRCNQCGTIVKDKARFCPNCGMPYFSSYDIDQTVSLNHEKDQKIDDESKDTDNQKTVYHGKSAYEESREADKRYEHEAGNENAWTQQDAGNQRDNSDRYGTFSSQRYVRNSQSTYSGQTSSDRQGGAGDQQSAYSGSYSTRSSYTKQQEPKKNNVLKIVLCILAAVVVVWAILVLLLVTDTGEIRLFGLINKTEEISEEEMLDGTWSGYADVTDLVYQSILKEDDVTASYFENVSLVVPLSYTFHYNAEESSVFEMSTDEEIVSQNIRQWFVEGFEPYLDDLIEQYDYDMTVDEYFELTGYSWEQFMEDSNLNAFIETYIDSINISGYYTALDGVIYVSDSEDVSSFVYDSIEVYELVDENELVVYGTGGENAEGFYPLTLYKQDE